MTLGDNAVLRSAFASDSHLVPSVYNSAALRKAMNSKAFALDLRGSQGIFYGCYGCSSGRRKVAGLSPKLSQLGWNNDTERFPLRSTNDYGSLRHRSRVEVVCNAVTSPFPSVTRSERTLALPIDYYQILGAETHFLADAITRAYEARLNHPPKDGFSNEALMARLEILRGARDTLVVPELRGDYNEGLMDDESDILVVDVPWSKVSGALCLLQEIGEMEVVLQAGETLLSEVLPKIMRRDVVLAMALAYVELSREAMAEATPTVVRSCDLLETALKLLQDEGGRSLAPALQEQVEEALEELTPRCVLELLALPIDKKHGALREEGLQGLRAILWAIGEGGAVAPIKGFTREQFIKEAFTFMTASEQVALWTSTPDNIAAESSEVYTVTLAHVAEGFMAKKPNLFIDADDLFWQLQLSNAAQAKSKGEAEDSDDKLDYCLERGMCKLLLGQIDESLGWLGLQEDCLEFRDRAVIEFVYLHSQGSEDGDVLPGLCKLLESWLVEVVLPTFRDTRSQQVTLGDYYDDPGVVNYLEQLERKNGGSQLVLSRIGAALDSVKASAIETLQKVFPLAKGGYVGPVQTAPDHGIDLPAMDLPQYVVQPQGGNDGISASSSSDLASSAPLFSNIIQGYAWGDKENSKVSSIPTGDDNGKPQPSVQEGLTPVQIACSGIVFGALVMMGMQLLPVQGGARNRVPDATNFATSKGVIEERQKDQQTKMDARLAEQVVRKWQTSKAQALGDTHIVSHLPEVLEGKMLESWTERVNEVARNGWYWEYRLVGLNIDSVTVSDDGRRAIVEATLQEAARLFDSKYPEHKDSYRSTYTTRYELQCGQNGWRITGGVVLRS